MSSIELSKLVSRETIQNFDTYEAMVRSWQTVKNLVAPSTINSIRSRHILDSVQLWNLRSQARRWIDIGSGAGFPGLVVAMCIKGAPDAEVHLVESDHRKCAFLRAVIRETDAPAVVHCHRIEDVLTTLPVPEVVTARALADLSQLLQWTAPLIEKGATGLFPKGRDVASELTGFTKYSNLEHHLVQSMTDPDGAIVVVTARGAPFSERNES